MARIGVVVRTDTDRAKVVAGVISSWCSSRGHELIGCKCNTHAVPGTSDVMVQEKLVNDVDLLITLGGDGTLLGVARHFNEGSPPVIGVHLGHLGFLTEITADEVTLTLEEFFQGRLPIEERSLLEAVVIREGREVFFSRGLNDAVVQKGSLDRLIKFDLRQNGHEIAEVRADGLVVSTPTGSTAYALAAGGSIVHPAISAFLVTPLLPHSLTIRPLILPMESEVTVGLPWFQGTPTVCIDGQVSFDLLIGDKVCVRRSKSVARFVQSPTRNYFQILREKLNWGIHSVRQVQD